MPIRITCPACQMSASVDDKVRGKRIRCPQCKEVFSAEPSADRADTEQVDRARPERRVGTKPSPPRPRDEDTERLETRPPSRLRKPSEEVEAPRRRPMRDRDEEDDKPSRIRKRAKAGPSSAFLVGIIGLGVVALTVLGGGLTYAFWPSGAKIDPSANANLNPVNDPPQKQPEVKEEPKPLPAALGADDLKRVKASTVYLRVEMPSGGIAQGTGFFAVEKGVIVTNAHVLGMLTPDSVAPRSVSVTVHSGEPNEFKVQGLVLGVDRTNDLAVLRTDATTSPLPPPLEVDSASKLMETQKVWVFGFPLGAQLGKAMTVTESSVTSLRKDPAGVLNQVQVKGGMNPGNSGGPVTDSRGVVVGVSVSIISGTEISFAIPGDFVTRVLAGSVSDQDFGTPFAGSGGQPQVPVRLTTLDPLQRIREVKVDVWTGPAGAKLPATGKEPQPNPGDGARQRVAATARSGGGFTADVPLPPLPAGQVYWAQPVVVNAAGVSQWSAALSIPFDPKLVIERKAALLQFKAPTGPIERTLKIKNINTANVFGLDEPFSKCDKLESYVLESSAPDTGNGGTRSHLHLDKPQFTREVGGTVRRAPDSIGDIVSRLSPSYLLAPNNSVKNFIRPGLNLVPLSSQEFVGDLFDSLCNTYEATTIPLPNKLVQPQETWPAKVSMLMSAGPPQQVVRMVAGRRTVRTVPGKREVRVLNLVCTYEGTRTSDGVHQGYVLLTGVVNGIRDKENEVYGKVNGHALVNLDSGMLSQVKATISFEADSYRPGVRILVTDENVIDRVEGNTQGIKIPVLVKNDPPVVPVDKPLPAGWKVYKSKIGAYTMWLPDAASGIKESNPTVRPKKIPKLQLNYTKVIAEAKDGPTYTAAVIDANPFTLIGKSKTVERIDWLREQLLEEDEGTVSGEKLISQGRVEGKEFLIEREKGTTRYRVYMFVNKYFLIAITGTKEQVESKDALTFLESFEISATYTGIMPKKDK